MSTAILIAALALAWVVLGIGVRYDDTDLS